MTFEEEKDYNNAKLDVIKAMNSIQKLKPELREQLLKELVGAEAYASVWQVLIRMGMLKESKLKILVMRMEEREIFILEYA